MDNLRIIFLRGMLRGGFPSVSLLHLKGSFTGVSLKDGDYILYLIAEHLNPPVFKLYSFRT